MHIKHFRKKARELNDNTCHANDNWILHFKHRHSLCSRKVTKREVIGSDAIHESANNFVNKVQGLLPQYEQANAINTDQSGLEIEMVGNRTISFRGVKINLGKVRSVHNTSCSYTVQFMLSLSGQPKVPCFLSLKESSGHINNNIKKKLFQASNITISCSKSGRLSTSLVQHWIQQVLKPTIGNKKKFYYYPLAGWTN